MPAAFKRVLGCSLTYIFEFLGLEVTMCRARETWSLQYKTLVLVHWRCTPSITRASLNHIHSCSLYTVASLLFSWIEQRPVNQRCLMHKGNGRTLRWCSITWLEREEDFCSSCASCPNYQHRPSLEANASQCGKDESLFVTVKCCRPACFNLSLSNGTFPHAFLWTGTRV